MGAELRAGWRTTFGLALLVGVVGGASVAAAAGARRTQSAYPRFLATYGAFHTEVSTGRDPETDVPESVAPAAGALIVAVAVVAFAYVIAAGAAEVAARVRPATVFRTE
jgi:hypothetical protein